MGLNAGAPSHTKASMDAGTRSRGRRGRLLEAKPLRYRMS
jgi:hypothetical protein